MRLRITDGPREVEITSRRATLPELEQTALRLLAALPPRDATPHTDEDTPRHTERPPFGFEPPTLDGVSLDSHTERAEPYTEPGRDEHDDYDDQHTDTRAWQP